MILNLSDSLSRGLVVAVSLVLGLTLSYFGVRTAVAAYSGTRETVRGLQLATRLEPANAEYWYQLGHLQQFSLDEADPEAAQRNLQKAIQLDPNYTDAWLDLATSYELEERPKEAQDAYLQAKRSYPASGEVSWKYGNFLLRQGDLDAAFPELRQTLASDPRLAAAAFSRVYRSNVSLDTILDKMLPPNPAVYLEILTATSIEHQISVAQTVWNHLLTLHPELKVADFDPLVSGLWQKGEYAESRRVWDQGVALTRLPDLLEKPGSVIWDPSFESGVVGRRYSWDYRPLADGVATVLDTTEKKSGAQSLRLTFDGRHNTNLKAACTLATVVPSMRYQLSAWMKTKELTTDQGVGITVEPMNDPNAGANYQTTRELLGTNPWTLVEVTWTSGPGTRVASVCVTRRPSLNADEQHITGSAWIDDVNLIPETLGIPSP